MIVVGEDLDESVCPNDGKTTEKREKELSKSPPDDFYRLERDSAM